MGCDIHLYREKLIDGAWVTADPWTACEYDGEQRLEIKYDNRAYSGRNYDLFGTLAKGVRSEFDFSFEARGLPLTLSPEVRAEYEWWVDDAHSVSYLYLHELRELAAFLKTATVRVEGMKGREGLAALNESIASGKPDWDLLYPYCQWASDTANYETFALDVPGDFKVGGCLAEILKAFDGIDGDNQRLVFWFDN